MSKRKLFLLLSSIILLCIYIVQVALSFKSPIKKNVISNEIDSIIIEKNGEEIFIAKINDEWVVGEKKYPANIYAVDQMISSLKEINILGKVEKLSNDVVSEKYELSKEKAIKVVAKENNKIVRTIAIGKSSSTGSQVYATLDEQNDILLLNGKLNDTFSKSLDELRSNSVYNIDQNTIKSVSQNFSGRTTFAKKEGDPEMWKLDGQNDVSSEKVSNWVSSLSSLSVNSWNEENFTLPQKEISKTTITTEAGDIVVLLFEAVNGDEKKYFASCNKTPYTFELNQYSAGKFMKAVSEFKD